MMTTARDLHGRHDPLAEGAGHLDPGDVLDPGLVFDTDPSAWQRVAAGTQRARTLNAASLALGDLVGPTTVERRITNVGPRRESYSVRVHGLRGVDVQAFPATVRLAPGRTRTIRLRVTARPTAAVDREVTGWLVWTGERHRVRVPVSVRPTVVAAPRQVDGAGGRGRVVVRGRSGNGRTVRLHSSGLVPATTTPVRLTPDAAVRTVRVPEGTEVARFAVDGPGDLDLRVYRGGTPVAGSVSPATRPVTLTRPAAGAYRVVVRGRAALGPGTEAGAVLLTWLVPTHGGAAVALSTDAVGFAPGRRFRYSASWEDLDPSRSYLGVVAYGDSGRRTLVEVTPR